jgi:5' nucleotidase, deoxy (Pyrimidine), cytosolic type C protein (NT5C)
MPLRIAFDLDGVLADMDAGLVREVEVLFGSTPGGPPEPGADAAPAALNSTALERSAARSASRSAQPVGRERVQDILPSFLGLRITARQQKRLWRHVHGIEGFWESLEEIEPGAVARLGAVAADRRWEVVFLTRRPQCGSTTAQVQTQRWLCANGFPLPSVCVVQGSRGRIAEALRLDFVVDDRPENCLDVVLESKAKAILVWRDDTGLPAAANRLGIGVVRSVHECLDILATIDSNSWGRRHVMARVMRLLGLNSEPANA